MTAAEALGIFQEYIADSSITSTTYLELALKKINTMFSRKEEEDQTLTTTADAVSIDTSGIVGLKRVNEVTINDGNDDLIVEKLRDNERKQKLIDGGYNRWEWKSNDLYFLQAFDTTGETVKLNIDLEYIYPTGANLFYLNELEDLFFMIAVKNYYITLLSTVMTSREDQPDSGPDEMRKAIFNMERDIKAEIKQIKEFRND